MKVVLTYGTYDLFHVGHARLLKRLRAMGDKLIVGCSTDEFNTLKGKKTVLPYAQREEVLKSCRYVDHVIPEENWEQKRTDIVEHNVDLFAMGDDWAGKFDDLEEICEVLYLARTPDISTTEIKEYMAKIQDDRIQRLRNTVDQMNALISKL